MKNGLKQCWGTLMVTVLAMKVLGQAQLTDNLTQPAMRSDTIISLIAEAQGLPLVAPEQVPHAGTFWLILSGNAVPLPAPFDDTLPVYQITPGQFLLDDGTVPPVVAAHHAKSLTALARTSNVEAQVEKEAATIVNLIAYIRAATTPAHIRSKALAMNALAANGLAAGSSYTLDTNQLWLQISNVMNGWVNLNLNHATNQVYAIWSATNLLGNWNLEQEIWPADGTSYSFDLPTLDRRYRTWKHHARLVALELFWHHGFDGYEC